MINENNFLVMYKEQEEIESSARTYAIDIDRVIVKGKGSLLFDYEGKRFIDCLAGAGTLATGHNHPKIKESLKNFLDSDNLLHSLDILTPIKYKFSKKLLELLPAPLNKESKLHFCSPSGADATEAAIKLFKTVTGRSNIISFYGAYHGMTAGAMALTGNVGLKESVSSLMPNVHFFPYPYSYRNPYGKNSDLVNISLNHIRTSLTDVHSGITKPAAVIVEAIQGEGGCIPAPVEWLKGLSNICKQLDIPLILDEIQSGFGRTGKMFAFEYAEIEPDAVLLSKAVGGGLPMSIIAYNKKYDTWISGAHTGTFRGNNLGMVAGNAFFNILSEENIIENVKRKGNLLHTELLKLQKNMKLLEMCVD